MDTKNEHIMYYSHFYQAENFPEKISFTAKCERFKENWHQHSQIEQSNTQLLK